MILADIFLVVLIIGFSIPDIFAQGCPLKRKAARNTKRPP
jgi:hypothetical protein